MSAIGDELAARLTLKQRAFVFALAKGKNMTDAYREAYESKASPKNVTRDAMRVRRNPKVAAYLQFIIGKEAKREELKRERKRQLLAEAAEDTTAKWGERIKAIEVDNVMTGDNAPQQVNVFGLAELLQLVRKGNQ